MRLNKIIFLPNVVLILRMLQQKAITNTLRIPERDSENIIASIVENVITISVKRKILRDFVIPHNDAAKPAGLSKLPVTRKAVVGGRRLKN